MFLMQFCTVFVLRVSLSQIQKLTRRWDTRTWPDVSSYMITYLPLNYMTHL